MRDLGIAEVVRQDVTVADGGVGQLPRPPRHLVQVRVRRGASRRERRLPAHSSSRKPDLQRHLVVLDAAFFEMAADRCHLEPVEVAEGLRGLLDRAVDRFGDAFGGGARDLHGLVDGVGHRPIITGTRTRAERPRQRRGRSVPSAAGPEGAGRHRPRAAPVLAAYFCSRLVADSSRRPAVELLTPPALRPGLARPGRSAAGGSGLQGQDCQCSLDGGVVVTADLR